MSAIEPDVLVRLARVFDIGFRNNIDDRWQTAADLREALLRVRAPVVAPAPAPPNVLSNWTLHVREGKPTGLYLYWGLQEASELEAFFESSGKEIKFGDLGRDLQEAALSLWSEVVVQPQLREAVRTRHAIDHLSPERCEPATLNWNQEIEVPNGRKRGPAANVEVASLSVPGRAAIVVLGHAAREAGRAAVENAQRRLVEWEARA